MLSSIKLGLWFLNIGDNMAYRKLSEYAQFRTLKIDRGEYLTLGVILFFVKYNIDRLIVGAFGSVGWLPWGLVDGGSSKLPTDKSQLIITIATIAIPFIIAGVLLTIYRLRSLDWPRWLAVIFFIPFINLLFFLLLSLIPTNAEAIAPTNSVSKLDILIPENSFGAAALGLFISAILGVVFIGFSVIFFENYAGGVFLGVPFVAGFSAAYIYSWHARRTFLRMLSVSVLTMFILGTALIAFAIEGFICVLMAAPIGIPLAMIGGTFAYFLQANKNRQSELLFSINLLLPILIIYEGVFPQTPPIFKTTTSTIVNAPQEQVWNHVVSFSTLPEPTDWVFKSGIAYPIRARIEGAGVGAIRHCEFSTGAFIEPITVWNEPHHLKFDVTSTPPPMQEWSPYSNLAPPHLHGFFLSKGGEFVLEKINDNTTRLSGTTWYEHKIWPAYYWKFFADALIHRIHSRVLEHIKVLTESETKI
jgi:hypothetical protein